MLCPYCKYEMKDAHTASREDAKARQIFLLCSGCGQPLARMVYGFRKPTDNELKMLSPGMRRAQQEWERFRDNPPHAQVGNAWKLVEKAVASVYPEKASEPLFLAILEVVFVAGAMAAKNAIKTTMHMGMDEASTEEMLESIEQDIKERGAVLTNLTALNDYFAKTPKEKDA